MLVMLSLNKNLESKARSPIEVHLSRTTILKVIKCILSVKLIILHLQIFSFILF